MSEPGGNESETGGSRQSRPVSQRVEIRQRNNEPPTHQEVVMRWPGTSEETRQTQDAKRLAPSWRRCRSFCMDLPLPQGLSPLSILLFLHFTFAILHGISTAIVAGEYRRRLNQPGISGQRMPER